MRVAAKNGGADGGDKKSRSVPSVVDQEHEYIRLW